MLLLGPTLGFPSKSAVADAVAQMYQWRDTPATRPAVEMLVDELVAAASLLNRVLVPIQNRAFFTDCQKTLAEAKRPDHKPVADIEAICRMARDFLVQHPPYRYRLQEAYRNPDGTYSDPHWDERFDFATGNGIDQAEAVEHILNEGNWSEMFHNPEDDPRPGCRRIIEVAW